MMQRKKVMKQKGLECFGVTSTSRSTKDTGLSGYNTNLPAMMQDQKMNVALQAAAIRNRKKKETKVARKLSNKKLESPQSKQNLSKRPSNKQRQLLPKKQTETSNSPIKLDEQDAECQIIHESIKMINLRPRYSKMAGNTRVAVSSDVVKSLLTEISETRSHIENQVPSLPQSEIDDIMDNITTYSNQYDNQYSTEHSSQMDEDQALQLLLSDSTQNKKHNNSMDKSFSLGFSFIADKSSPVSEVKSPNLFEDDDFIPATPEIKQKGNRSNRSLNTSRCLNFQV